jgi:hypothetical protein
LTLITAARPVAASVRMLIGVATLSAMAVTGGTAQMMPVDIELTPVVGGMLFLGELPQVIGGAGTKTYDFEGVDAVNHFMWNVGAGVDVALHPRASLRLEARDYMSLLDPEVAGLDDEIQHDLALSAGLSFRLGGR